MAVDILQEKIRKLKCPLVVDLTVTVQDLPSELQTGNDGDSVIRFYREMLDGLKGHIPAVRFSFAAFALAKEFGLELLSEVLKYAQVCGFYTILDAPEILSPRMAKLTADSLLGTGSAYPCDAVVISGYLGSDVIRPFLPYCGDHKKDIFVVVRTPNKSASEIQDLLTGSRLVHAAAADYVNRYASDTVGRGGYSRVGLLAAASSAESLKQLRGKYGKLFLLVDGLDYSGANAKNCAPAFDKMGHGAVVCVSEAVTCAWKQADGEDGQYVAQAVAASERMKKNILRYISIL